MNKGLWIILAAVLLSACSNETAENESRQAEISEEANTNETAVSLPAENSVQKPVIKEENSKAYYLGQLDQIDLALTKLENSYKTGSTAALEAGETESLRRWDKALNEIYGELKGQLAPGDMEQVRIKQREWIDSRDQQAEEAAAEFAGGTLASVAKISKLKQLTKERCYFLAGTYLSEGAK